jgi:signal transduction histidine kinase
MPRLDGMGLLRHIQADHPDIGVIMISAHGTLDQAVLALKTGAVDYIAKPLPIDLHEVYLKCERFFRLQESERQRRYLQHQVTDLARFPRSNPNFVARADLAADGQVALYPGNQRSAGILGHLSGRPADSAGRFPYCRDGIGRFFPADFRRTLRQITQRGEVAEVERHKMEERFYNHTYTPFADSADAVFLHVTDVTRQVRDEHLRQSLEAGMEHEFKNLLSSITPQAELLEQGYLGPLQEQQREALGRIIQAGGRLLDSLEHRLRFSRAYAGDLHLAPKKIELNQLAAETYKNYVPGPDRRLLLNGAALPPNGPTQPPAWAVCDPQYIGQVLNNLIGNALQYSAWVDTRIEVKTDGVEVSVLDGGGGIDDEDRCGIWNLGYRAKNRRSSSSGIGLPYSKLVVEGHGGHIGVESDLGKGSRFYFFLP